MMDEIGAALIGALLFGLAVIRRRAIDRHGTQLSHLRSANDLLKSYASSLERVLQAESVPDHLKIILLKHSDILSSAEGTNALAQGLLSNDDYLGEENRVYSDEYIELQREIDALSKSNPEFLIVLLNTIVTGTLGSVLRFPQTASNYEAVSARLLSGVERDKNLAKTMSQFRALDLPFRASGRRPAMA